MTGLDMLAHRIAELEDPIGTVPFRTVGHIDTNKRVDKM